MQVADASPTKEFFVDNLTRDLSVEDAILDLLDNSIDSLARTRDLQITSSSLKSSPTHAPTGSVLPEGNISIAFNENEFLIEDDCGGIEMSDALQNVFRFGRSDSGENGLLGVYGIGLKRAVFKIGRRIEISSMTRSGGFRTTIDVPAWMAKPEWSYDLDELPADQPNMGHTGTRVHITSLTDDAIARAKDPTFLAKLKNSIATSYACFIGKYICVQLDGHPVESIPLPIGFSEELAPGFRKINIGGVSAEILAGISAEPSPTPINAGWFVICNGRVVLRGNKSTETGWGVSPMPQFHNKYYRFLGIAFLFSQNPSLLPWSTTKRGINTDSSLYETIRSEMSNLGRPVTAFLNKLYPNDLVESPVEREMVKDLEAQNLNDATSGAERSFQPKSSRRKASEFANIQYRVNRSDLLRAARALGNQSLPGKEVGERTFHYFLKHEVGE